MTSAGIAAIACGRSNVLYTGDAYGSGQIGSGGSGAVHTGGTGGVGKGGSGGAGGGGGTLSGGGTFGMGGTIAAGGSSGGSAGAPSMGGVSGGPYACSGVEATCDAFHDFPFGTEPNWGDGAFTGGIAVFGELTRDMDATGLHVTGTITSLASGFNLWFTRCSDLSAYTGVLMTLSGTAMPSGYVTFQVLTNSTYPWQPRPQDGKGACTSPDPLDPYGYCVPPSVDVFVTGFPVAMTWSALSGGMPVAWDTMTSPQEIVGLQWLLPFDGTPYSVDLRLDDLYLLSSEAPVDCVSSMGGMGGVGGIGGMSGAAGIAGTAGSAGGIAGEAGAPQGGVGNEGGMSGEGGAPATAGAPESGFGGI